MILLLLLILLLIVTIVAACYRPPHKVGPPGKAGIMGDIGVSGVQGIPGITGPTGNFYQLAPVFYGPTGPTGYTGTDTVIGPPGPVGMAGPTGSSTGPTGLPGMRGPTIVNGSTGPTGGAGPMGATGATGIPSPGLNLFAVSYSFTQSISPPSFTWTVSETDMQLNTGVQTLPSSEFTYNYATGTMQFLQPQYSYLIRVGIDITLTGLTTGWQPSTVVLHNFPNPATVAPITLWPAAYSSSAASASMGSTVVYTSPGTFSPQITVNLSGLDDASVQIYTVSIAIEHVAP